MNVIDSYQGNEPGLEIVILRNDADNSFVKKCIYNEDVELLNIGETTYHKRFDKLNIYFPFVIFDILECKKYGLKIDCNINNNFWTFKDLTCDPQDLKLIETVSFYEAVGNHIKEEIFQCPKCSRKWMIKEEYDTHHGFNRNCSRIYK